MINFGKDMRYMHKMHKLCLDCLLVICPNKSDTVMIQQDVRRLTTECCSNIVV